MITFNSAAAFFQNDKKKFWKKKQDLAQIKGMTKLTGLTTLGTIMLTLVGSMVGLFSLYAFIEFMRGCVPNSGQPSGYCSVKNETRPYYQAASGAAALGSVVFIVLSYAFCCYCLSILNQAELPETKDIVEPKLPFDQYQYAKLGHWIAVNLNKIPQDKVFTALIDEMKQGPSYGINGEETKSIITLLEELQNSMTQSQPLISPPGQTPSV